MRAPLCVPEMVRVAKRVHAAVTADPSLAADNVRLTSLIRDELVIVSKLFKIPSCLRDES
jgi:hypothetical protein